MDWAENCVRASMNVAQTASVTAGWVTWSKFAEPSDGNKKKPKRQCSMTTISHACVLNVKHYLEGLLHEMQ